MPRIALIQPRRGTAAAWTATNPVLAIGEPGMETDTGKEKLGDGLTAWAALPYKPTAADVAKMVPRWAPTTAYTAGQQVVSPNNDVVSAIAAHTSSASFTPANWSGSGTYGPHAATIIPLGDSFTGNGGGHLSPGAIASLTAGSITYDEKLNYSRGFWVWAMNLLGQRLRVIHDAGVGGETTVQILARTPGDVVAFKPGWCHLLAGINDVAQNVPLATTKANLTSIWDQLDAAGIRIIVGTIGPLASYVSTQRAQIEQINAWIRDQARQRGMVLVDYHAVLVNATSNGVYSTGLNFDSTHPNTLGSYFMGLAMANAISPLIAGAPFPYLLSGQGDSTNLLVEGRFGTTGNGSPLTGNWGVATTGTPSITWSKVPRTDIPGNWQSIAMLAGANVAFAISGNASVGANLAIGDTVIGCLEYQLSGLDTAGTAGNHSFYLQLQAYNGASFTLTAADLLPLDAAGFPTASRSGVLLTPPITVPAGTTLMQMQIKGNGGGTYLIDRAGMFNITRLAMVG
jgi:lysophospholipase L1-like esterase